MKKIIKWVLYLIITLIIVVLVIGLIVPKEIDIRVVHFSKVPSERITPYFQHWSKWKLWSPWVGNDTTLKVDIQGEDGKVGSVYHWTSENSGEGKMVAKDIDAYNLKFDLQFVKPFEGNYQCEIFAQDTINGTNISWTYHGAMSYPWNALAYLFDMKSSIQNDFNKGLQKLSFEAEKSMKYAYIVDELPNPGIDYIITRGTVKFENIAQFFGTHFGRLFEQAEKNQWKPCVPTGLSFVYDEEKGETQMAAAVELNNYSKKGKLDPGTEILTVSPITAPTLLKIYYYGPYNETGKAHETMDKYMADHGYELVIPVIERYITDPSTEPNPNRVLTEIVYPVQKKK